MGRGKGVRATSDTSIGISFQYRGARCRERIKLPPSEANKKYVARLKATIEHEIATGTFDYAKHFPNSPRARKFARTPGAAVTVAEQLRTWLDSKAAEIQPETWDEYEKDCRKHLMPEFGELRLAEIGRQHVKAWAARSTLSRKRLNNILIPLRSMLNDAADHDPPLIPRNPLHGFELKRVRTLAPQTEEVIDPFTHEEIRAICAHADPQVADMAEFWCWSGLRPQEIFVVMWPDIDWLHKRLRVQRALREGRVKVTKTEAGQRDVTLLEPALKALERQKARTYLAGKHIWHNPRTGEPWTGDGPLRKTAWVHTLKRAGVRYRPPKQLRHTFASWMLSAGENPLWVARMMGHEDWSMIVKTYGKWIPSVDPLAGTRAVAAIYGTIRATGEKNAS